ncbi:MAG: GNAT family N-acetyltransferase [Xanthobacteraceae bacterium]|jgi:L-amino acid N-acyltransferase YncA
MAEAGTTFHNGIRALNADDLERVIIIDRAHSGRSRRHFFEKRFAAAAAHPDEFIQIGVTRDGSLRGFAIARLFRGEFGREPMVAMLDAIGVEMEVQEQGVGHMLMDGLIETLRPAGVHTLQSQAEWTNHGLMRFFDASGFKLAHRVVLERSTSEPLAEASIE